MQLALRARERLPTNPRLNRVRPALSSKRPLAGPRRPARTPHLLPRASTETVEKCRRTTSRSHRGGAIYIGRPDHVYGASAIDIPERGLYGPFFSKVGKCSNPNFHDAGLAVAQVDLWIIDFLAAEKRITPKDVVVVGQSAGGWASIALSSMNPPQIGAIITFAAGRGGRVGGKPNNNCAPDKLVEATMDFGRTSRVPMLWIYIENDTFFGPALSKRMHEAFTSAGGKAQYHLVPPFGDEGHFFVGSPDAIPIWSPLVSRFLDEIK